MTLQSFAQFVSTSSNPGPGYYEIDTYKKIGGSDSIKTSIKSRYQESKNENSNIDYAPLNYDLGGRKSTIGSRLKQRSETPSANDIGPDYVPQPSTSHQGIKIKGSRSDKVANDNPGPGYYDPHEPTKNRLPQMGPRGPIFLGSTPSSPGPAAYNISRDITDSSIKYSIRPIITIKNKNNIDPGYTYNSIGSTSLSSHSFTIPKAPRLSSNETDSPGPGAYEQTPPPDRAIGPIIPPPHKEYRNRPASQNAPLYNLRSFPQGKKYTIGNRGDKTPWQFNPNTPGPDFFPPDEHGRKVAILNRIPTKIDQSAPGPGTYNITPNVQKNYTGFTMKGPSIRDGWFTPGNLTPGPQYSIPTPASTPKWSFGDNRRKSQSPMKKTQKNTPKDSSRFQTPVHKSRSNLD